MADEDGGGGAVVIDEDDTKEEKDLLYELYGRNEVPVVKVWGWTRSTVMSFPNLKENLRMQRFDKTNETDKKGHQGVIEESAEIAEGISRLAKFADSLQYQTSQFKMLCVQVIAKKKVDTIVVYPKDEEGNCLLGSPGQVLILGQLIVADESGACLLSLFNESVQIIYNQVDVGDYLIMNKFQYKKVKVEEEDMTFGHPFQKLLCPVELKIEKYSVRHIRHFPWQKQSFKIQLPSFLFPDLDTAGGSGEKPPSEELEPVVYEQITGVVCHVGRIERTLASTHIIKCAVNESIESEERRDRIIRFFTSYRWIRVIDKSGESHWVKIFVENLSSMKTQEELVPGAVVLITNCSVGKDESGKTEIYTGVYSEVYINEQVGTYCRLLPEVHVETLVSSVLGLRAYIQAIENGGPCGIGGTYHPPMTSPAKYLKAFKEMEEAEQETPDSSSGRQIPFTAIPKGYAFMEREQLVLKFRAKIMLVWEVWEGNCTTHMPLFNGRRVSLNTYIYGNYDKVYAELRKCANEPSMFIHRYACICSKCRIEQWLSLARKVQMEVPSGLSTTRQTISVLTENFKELCSPLLPTFALDENKTANLKLLADLPLLKEFSHYRLVLQDLATGQFYEAMWDTYSMKAMRDRINAAVKKEIVCEIHIFQLPCRQRMEVVLRDFVVDEEAEEWRRNKRLCVEQFTAEHQRLQNGIHNDNQTEDEDSRSPGSESEIPSHGPNPKPVPSSMETGKAETETLSTQTESPSPGSSRVQLPLLDVDHVDVIFVEECGSQNESDDLFEDSLDDEMEIIGVAVVPSQEEELEIEREQAPVTPVDVLIDEKATTVGRKRLASMAEESKEDPKRAKFSQSCMIM